MEVVKTWDGLLESAKTFRKHARANNTVRAYAKDWHGYEVWCKSVGQKPVPGSEELVCAYLAFLAEVRQLKAVTIRRSLSGLRKYYYQAMGRQNPAESEAVGQVMQGILRDRGEAPRKVKAITVKQLRRILKHLPPTLMGLRDRALLLVGFAGAFRRSELCALDVEDLEFTKEGVICTIRRSKGDQLSEGRRKDIDRGRRNTCPVAALEEWLEAAGITEGPVFRAIYLGDRLQKHRLTEQSVSLVVKARLLEIGENPSDWSSHSLRAGFVTEGLAAGEPEAVLMGNTHHKDRNMIRRYYRPRGLTGISKKVGL